MSAKIQAREDIFIYMFVWYFMPKMLKLLRLLCDGAVHETL